MSTDAIDNAKAWYADIREMVDRANQGSYTQYDDSDLSADVDAAEDAIQESALSVRVRSGWHAPDPDYGSRMPAEYEILLTTGGPALRIVGDLDGHSEPVNATLEWQDWGTPWTPLHMSELADEAVLLRYASHFYFGE